MGLNTNLIKKDVKGSKWWLVLVDKTDEKIDV